MPGVEESKRTAHPSTGGALKSVSQNWFALEKREAEVRSLAVLRPGFLHPHNEKHTAKACMVQSFLVILVSCSVRVSGTYPCHPEPYALHELSHLKGFVS